jgi:hypothetical protein
MTSEQNGEITDPQAQAAKFALPFERVMTPELALLLVESGVNLERTGRGLPAIDFSDSSG